MTPVAGLAGIGPPVQVAYAVPDAETAAAEWSRRWRAGPFFVRRHIALTDVVYRGWPATFDHTSAYGQWGSLMVELVQDHGAEPSPVRERYGPDETGLHHLACFVDDLEAALTELSGAGHDTVMTATAGTTPFAFVDLWASHGHLLELYPGGVASLRAFYAMVAAAADGWDGRDPVRVIE